MRVFTRVQLIYLALELTASVIIMAMIFAQHCIKKNKSAHHYSGKCVFVSTVLSKIILSDQSSHQDHQLTENWKQRNPPYQSKCVGVASFHPVLDPSSFSTQSFFYKPFMLSVSVALTKNWKPTCSRIPVDGVDLILGNDLDGHKVLCRKSSVMCRCATVTPLKS